MSKDIFSKHLPNIKLSTKFNADGFEIPVRNLKTFMGRKM